MSLDKYIKGIISLVKMAAEYKPDRSSTGTYNASAGMTNKNDVNDKEDNKENIKENNIERSKGIIPAEAKDISCEVPKIHILHKWEKSGDLFAPGVLLYIENGKGLLHEEYYDDYAKESFLSLMFGEMPLFQFQGSEYFCPTCEKIVKSGYNLEKTEVFSCDVINEDGAAFGDVVEQMKPLLGLLEEGFYCLWDTKLYPTDGNGNLFWDYPNEDKELPGSCACYLGDYHYAKMTPRFTIATQPKRLYNPERAKYYRDKKGSRAIAYYMDGNLTALIDGHHKAMAAAMEHREVSAVVISRCHYSKRKKSDGTFEKQLSVNDISFSEKNINIDSIEYDVIYDRLWNKYIRSERYIPITNTDDTAFPFDTKALASQYPTVFETGCIDYFDQIDDELIDGLIYGKSTDGKIASKPDRMSYLTELQFLIEALAGIRHKRFFEVVDHILHTEADVDTLLMCIKLIGRKLDMGDTMGSGMDIDGIKDYLITYMAEIEDEFPAVGKEIFMIL